MSRTSYACVIFHFYLQSRGALQFCCKTRIFRVEFSTKIISRMKIQWLFIAADNVRYVRRLMFHYERNIPPAIFGTDYRAIETFSRHFESCALFFSFFFDAREKFFRHRKHRFSQLLHFMRRIIAASSNLCHGFLTRSSRISRSSRRENAEERRHLIEIPPRKKSSGRDPATFDRSVSRRGFSEDSYTANIRRTVYRANDEGGWDVEKDEGAVRMVRNTGLNIYPGQTENSDVAVSCERFRKIWCERTLRREEMFVGIRDRSHSCNRETIPATQRNVFRWLTRSSFSLLFTGRNEKYIHLPPFQTAIITTTFWLSTRHYCVMTFFDK